MADTWLSCQKKTEMGVVKSCSCIAGLSLHRGNTRDLKHGKAMILRKRAQFIISGRVQGVCYRMYACREAESLGLTGWVRNRPDGTVQLVAEGEESDLMAMRAWCARGPSYAIVRGVEEEYFEATGEFDGFTVTY